MDTNLQVEDEKEHPAPGITELADIEDKQALLCKVNDTDLEAQRHCGPGHKEDDTEVIKASPAVLLSSEELRQERSAQLDNLRTTLICLLVIQNTVIVAISTDRDAFHLEETAPNALAAAILLIGMGRMLLVPMLFFVSGFSAKIAAGLHRKSLVLMAGKRFLAVVFLQGTVWLSKQIHGEVNPVQGARVPYYASHAGRESLLNGPTFYVLALLALDYIYFICWSLNAIFLDHKHIINTRTRYNAAKTILGVLLEVWIMCSAIGNTLSRLPEDIQQWIYTMNSAELHFPFLYLAAYLAGVQFVAYHKFSRTPLIQRFPAMVLSVRLIVIMFGLGTLYHYFPETIPAYLDPRTQPRISLVGHPVSGRMPEYAGLLYGLWAAYAVMYIPESLVCVFFHIPKLARAWGRFSRYSYIQIYVQLLLVLDGSGAVLVPAYIENVILRGLFTGVVSLCVGYMVSVCLDTMRGWVVQRWKAVLSHEAG